MMVAMQKCPFPGCEHVAQFVTNVHCEKEHGKSKSEIVERYGQPQKQKKNTTFFLPKKNRF